MRTIYQVTEFETPYEGHTLHTVYSETMAYRLREKYETLRGEANIRVIKINVASNMDVIEIEKKLDERINAKIKEQEQELNNRRELTAVEIQNIQAAVATTVASLEAKINETLKGRTS